MKTFFTSGSRYFTEAGMIVLSEQAQTAKEVRREVETSLETKDLRERLSHRRSKVAV